MGLDVRTRTPRHFLEKIGFANDALYFLDVAREHVCLHAVHLRDTFCLLYHDTFCLFYHASAHVYMKKHTKKVFSAQ